jgi:glycosyltransferase involved in cell wall biosynthesis
MKQVDISVVVPTYNNAEMLSGALASLICQETDGQFSYEILVIDNGSSDGTRAVVSEIASYSQVPVRYVCEEGHGIAHARNRGVSESRGKWIAWFDDDQLADNDWLKSLLAFAMQMGADCVAGTRLLDLPLEQPSPLGLVCRGLLGEDNHHEAPAICRGKAIPGFGYILMARTVFDSIGLFDTSMLWSGEDTDILLRARAAGFDLWATPNAVVHHVILPHCVEPIFLRWVSLRCACVLAQIDCKRRGPGGTLLLCVARIGQALLVNMPRLLLAYVKRDKAEILDRKCLVLRAIGYTRKTLFLIAPRVFTQERFFARLEFRKKRTFKHK